MGNRWVGVAVGLVGWTSVANAGCSSTVPASGLVQDSGPRDAPLARDAVVDVTAIDAGNDAARMAVIDAAPEAAIDAPCVPKTQAEACAGRNCGFAPDGCKSGYGCGNDGGGGTCPTGQGCGAVAPNVCGGCVPDLDAAQPTGCSEGLFPYIDCPIVMTDAGVGPYVPPDCVYNEARNLACCP
jgi:hypothetical protein